MFSSKFLVFELKKTVLLASFVARETYLYEWDFWKTWGALTQMEVLLLEYTVALYNMRGLLQRKKGQQILDKQLMDSYNIQFCHNNIIIFYIQLLSKVYLLLNPTSVVFNIP